LYMNGMRWTKVKNIVIVKEKTAGVPAVFLCCDFIAMNFEHGHTNIVMKTLIILNVKK